MGTLPALPLAPRLVRAGVSWVTLEWGRPEGSPSEEQLKYTLEIQEDNTVSSARLNTGPTRPERMGVKLASLGVKRIIHSFSKPVK